MDSIFEYRYTTRCKQFRDKYISDWIENYEGEDSWFVENHFCEPSFFLFFFFVPRLIYTSTSHCRLSRVSTSLRSAPPFMTAVKSSLQRIVTEIDGVKSERQPLLIDIKVKPYWVSIKLGGSEESIWKKN